MWVTHGEDLRDPRATVVRYQVNLIYTLNIKELLQHFRLSFKRYWLVFSNLCRTVPHQIDSNTAAQIR
ncbi:hypothetical protein D9M71_780590 [compost metagenome]